MISFGRNSLILLAKNEYFWIICYKSFHVRHVWGRNKRILAKSNFSEDIALVSFDQIRNVLAISLEFQLIRNLYSILKLNVWSAMAFVNKSRVASVTHSERRNK